MNQADIGKFIAKCRKDKQLTQAQLAELLNVTDRAVSKWETGKCMPDSSIMLTLCEILGISVNELLSGEEVDQTDIEKKADENLIALKRKNENQIKRNTLYMIFLSVICLIGISVCFICDLALSGDLTWSLIPISSIIFTWVIALPVIILGKQGIVGCLLAISIFVIPYLYVLSNILNVKKVFSIGAVESLIAIICMWLIFWIFRRFRERKLFAFGIAFILMVPFMLIVNITISIMISEPVIDRQDIFSVILLLIFAFTFFVCDYAKKA